MVKLVKGDRVVLKGFAGHEDLPLGSVGTVVRVEKGYCVTVEWDNFDEGHDDGFNDGRSSIWNVPSTYLEIFEEISPELLFSIVNMPHGTYCAFEKGEQIGPDRKSLQGAVDYLDEYVFERED